MNLLGHRILVAGSTGYLGGHIVNQLKQRKANFKALARNSTKLYRMGITKPQMHIAELTDEQSLIGCCNNMDVVISCVGITRQKDGLRAMDVDYRANLNLLEEAEIAGVKKFIYISAFNAPKYRNVRLLNAKERFADRLLASEKLQPCVIRPNGYYSDLEEFYNMAKSGRAYLFGEGNLRLNPIHGEDLAKFCLDIISQDKQEYDVGGPQILSAKEIAELAFIAQHKTARITHIPDWLRKLFLVFAAKLPEQWVGSAEFFLSVMAKDMIAPTYGQCTLLEHYQHIYALENGGQKDC